MRDTTSASGVALRAPLAPFDRVLRWTGPEERAVLRERLRTEYDDPVLREAVLLAAPAVADALARWRAGGADLAPRVERTLVAYLLRSAGRCTPFGLFAGCGAAGTAAETRLDLGDTTGIRRRSRLDFGYLDALTAALVALPEVRAGMTVRPNSTLYRAAGRYRHAVSTVRDGVRSHHLAATDPTPALDAVVALAAPGAAVDVLAEELRAELADPGLTPADTAAFVADLVDAQLLVPVGGPAVTGDLPPESVLDGMPEVPAVVAARAALRRVATQLAELDALAPGQPGERYRGVVETLAALPAPVDPARLVQVDTAVAAQDVRIGPAVVDAARDAARLLARLCPPPPDPLAAFREAFTARYEERFVPLLEALDADAGVGHRAEDASPLAGGLPLPRRPAPAAWGPREDVLLRLLGDAQREGRTEIRLVDADLRALDDPRGVLPTAYHVHATVAAADARSVDAGEFRLLLRHVDGPSGAAFLGRFCHLTPGLRAVVDTQLRAEERQAPDRVHAEVVHLPEGRTGNVVARPVLRGWEIAFLGRSGARADRQLAAADLHVGVVAGRVVLRSERLGVEVVPRLTTAHDYTGYSLAVYRFLCDLQFQHVRANLDWSWGPLGSAPFLPRVVTGRVVLARARWRIGAGDAPRTPDAVRAWRQRAGVPRWIVLADGDNELVLDLDNVLCVDLLLAALRPGRPTVVLELFPTPDEMCLHGPGGRYVHELLIPFVAAPPPPVAAVPARRTECATRRFAPGSEWLSVRLYGGEASADEVLLEAVGPLVDAAREEGLSDRWFFLRYADPDTHLRVRWRGDAAALLPRLHDALAPLLDDGLLWRVDVGTYEREIERYGGGAGVELAEEIFTADSDAALEILDLLDGDLLAEGRWRLALVGADRLLRDLRLSPDERARWADRTRRDLLAEDGDGADLVRELGRRFRPRAAELADLLDGRAATPEVGEALAVLDRRSSALAPLVDRLLVLEKRGELTRPVADLAGCYVHMHVNRMVRSTQRRTEMVLADWLRRLYRGARERT